jgi:hypothetical protein
LGQILKFLANFRLWAIVYFGQFFENMAEVAQMGYVKRAIDLKFH